MPFGLKLPKSDEEILKLSTSETWALLIVTGGWYGFWWCACLMRAINKQLGRPVFNVNRTRNTTAFSFAGFVLALPFLIIVLLMSPSAGAVFGYTLLGVMLILLIGVPARVFYRIASRIREMEMAQGNSDLVSTWVVIPLFFLYYLEIPYPQYHVNRFQWESTNSRENTAGSK